ncbi:hypothetical protein R69927_05565 [Paraburkholderia domus]|jgi:hypothetical protein|uniref:Uncharacterized protein n=1 Tax=Paraburkholderia domus TaxID=2793075 RepID=A0A9N8NDH6_9BURK|nr:hypothetical protein [Paraburkholderia domus]MBK5053010.1 hypothetical protein [Burkholderia sp. R-70006]MBK5065330.1 hypothetical protein [Burkholderia sp. R-70199]MBK5089764.1 hypothetical protein [Burkholderia sp. R-69927]MBK5124462.1 hypothetical protein [Burkholderia sp. R-69980]MBK5168780.1 hypothetical protein [Burkholderia sp. R-70211]MBK5184090.1 hypothetical protein [Burkholderia sp. R-69749]MCI0147695.1 hypothetical protein [Paraburkholderia sediminicola]
MNYTRKYLSIAVLIMISMVAFSLGCLFLKKQDTGKTTVSAAKGGDARIVNTNSNANDLAASMNPYPASSPIHGEFDEFRNWVLNNKKLAAHSDSTSPGHLLRLSGELAVKGLPRLSTDLLEQRLSAVTRILPSLDTHMCSMFLKGGINATEFMVQASSVMESFSDDEAKAWFTVNKAAIEAQLDGSPLIVLSTEEATRGVLKIARSMYEPESTEFISGLSGLKTANDEDTCATVRTLYSKGNALPEPYRGYMARMLLTGKDGNEKF